MNVKLKKPEEHLRNNMENSHAHRNKVEKWLPGAGEGAIGGGWWKGTYV